MSDSIPNYSAIASGTIYGGRFVTQTGSDFVVAQSTTGDLPIGISKRGTKDSTVSYRAADGDPVAVFSASQLAYLQLGNTVNAGDRLKPDTDGKGIASTSGPSAAVAMQDGTAGAYIQVQVRPDFA